MGWNWPPEVTVAVIGLIGILLGTAVGGAVSLITTQMNRKDQAAQREQDRKDRAEEARRQEERWQAEFFLKLHVDALHASQRALVYIRVLINSKVDFLDEQPLAPTKLDAFITLFDQATTDWFQAFSPLVNQMPADVKEIMEDVNKQSNTVFNQLATLLDVVTFRTVSPEDLKDLSVAFATLDEKALKAIRLLSTLLAPPALKRFIEQ